MKNYTLTLLFFLIVLPSITFASWWNPSTWGNKGFSGKFISSPFEQYSADPLGQSVINCEFKVISDFMVDPSDDFGTTKIRYQSKSSEPINITFSGLNTLNPVMKGNGGEDPLIFLDETNTQVTFASSNAFGDMFIYKIYKDKKVATWYKSYELFGKPYAMLSMGYCY